MNNKEKILKLALAILDYHTDVDSNTGLLYCLHCDTREKIIGYDFINHKPDCPVLLAEEVLKDEANNGVLLTGQKVLVLSKNRKGIIIGGPDSNNLYEVSLTPQWRGCYKREDLLLTPFNDALEELQSDISKPKPSKERFCPSCGEGKVEEVKGTEPYSEDYLMCNKCDSTFNKEHMKEICKSRVDLQKKHMKLYELQHYVDKLIEQGYSDTPVYFDTEAKTYDCHIVPIGSINLVPKEAMGEDYIILYEYQYTEKSEEPLIVHNVMSYKGKNYLRQLGNCTDCSIYGIECHNDISIMQFGYKTKCVDTNTIWKSFDDIQITDELACMRKDIGDIYVFNIQEDQIDKLVYVENDRDMYVHTLGWRSTNKNIRLATAEEIQKIYV